MLSFAEKLKKMKSIVITLAALFSFQTYSQNLPRVSQKAEVEQMVGMTEIEVEYFRPNVNDRTIFGDLVPFDEVWRTGANNATVIEFSTDVMINGKNLEKGSYAIFTKPGKKTWDVMFNKDHEQWGAYNYDSSMNALTVTADVQEAQPCESFTIEFTNVVGNKADMVIMWETTKIALKIEVEVDKYVDDEINRALADTSNKPAEVHLNAANYYLKKGDYSASKKHLSESIKLDKTNWSAYWTQARIAEKEEDYKSAVKYGKIAVKTGVEVEGDEFPYEDRLNEIIAEWEAKK